MNNSQLIAWLQGPNSATTQTFYQATTVHRTAEDIAAINGINPQQVIDLNPTLKFPVSVGTRVRIGP